MPAPLASNDFSYETLEDFPLTLLSSDLISNDTDPDGDPLSIISVQGVTHGVVALNQNGDVVFSPDTDYYGPASFTYTISDGQGGTSTATVSLTVLPVSDPGITVNGTAVHDVLNGSAGDDMINGAAGNDIINGFGGDDLLIGGTGVDTINGGTGFDTVSYKDATQNVSVSLSGNGQVVASGSEYRVNSYISGEQLSGDVTALSDGGYVIVWASNEQDGSGWGIYSQRYDANGMAVGSEFRVNTTTVDDQNNPDVAGLAGGGFIVTWEGNLQDGSGTGIYAQRYDASGVAVGSEFLINSTVADAQNNSQVAALVNGNFVVTWTSSGQDGSGTGVYGQRYDANGIPIGSEFRVNTETSGDQDYSAISALNDGGFIVTWETDSQDGSGTGVYGQRYDVNGIPIGSEFRVNTNTTDAKEWSAVTSLDNGGIVVVWQSMNQDGSLSGIYGQIYDANGLAVGSEFLINQTTNDTQDAPHVTYVAGGFLVTWDSYEQDGDGWGLCGRRFDSNGNPVTGEFQINSYTPGDQSVSKVETLSDGSVVIVWNSQGQDGSGFGIYSQRFELQEILINVEGIIGSDYNDTLTGDNNSNRISGGTGNDVINGLDGDDILIGGAGVDTINGGTGFDVVSYEEAAQGVFVSLNNPALPSPVGNEFRVNTTTANDQTYSNIGALNDGGYVVVWASGTSGGNNFNVYGQRYDAQDNPTGSEFLINTAHTSGEQYLCEVQGLLNGGFLVTWTSNHTGNYDVYGQRYDVSGAAVGGEFRFNTCTSGTQSRPHTAVLSDGGFVTAWISNLQDGSGYGIYGRRYDAQGNAIDASEFRINSTVSGDQNLPSIAALNDGGFIVTWRSNQNGNADVYGQRYNAQGQAVGNEFQISTYSNQDVTSCVIGLSNGGFAVFWESYLQDGDSWGIYAQMYDANGLAVGNTFCVNTTTTNKQSEPLASAVDDGFIVSWTSYTQDGDRGGIYSRRYDLGGNPVTGEVLINGTTSGNQGLLGQVTLENGSVAFAWHAPQPGSNAVDTYARHFAVQPLNEDTLSNVEGIIGSNYNDTLAGDSNNNFLDGRSGTDIAIYSGNQADYTITFNQSNNTVTITDNRPGSPNGQDTLTNIEIIRFADGNLILSQYFNFPPTDILVTGGSVAENSPAGTVVATLATIDPNSNETFTYSITNDPSGFFEINNNEIRVRNGAQINYETATSYNVTVQVTDSAGNTYSESISLSVSNVNETPVAVADTGLITTEDTSLSIAAAILISNDSDVDGDALTISSVSATSAQGASVFLNNDGSVSYNPAASASLNALAVGQSVTDTFSYTISDGHGGTSTSTVSVLVTGQNDAVLLVANLPDSSVTENSSIYLPTADAFDDVDTTDALTFTAMLSNGSPLPSWLSINTTTGELTGTAPNLTAGDQAFNIQVTASDGLTSISNTFSLTVLDTPPAPNIITGTSGDDNLTGTAGKDNINALGGNDTLLGLGDDDTLRGGQDDDVINGGIGNDQLIGNGGNDTFIFDPDFGHDTITDFSAGAGIEDIIQLNNLGYTDFASVLSDAYQNENDVIIAVDANNSITLKNTTLAQLHDNDFSFMS